VGDGFIEVGLEFFIKVTVEAAWSESVEYAGDEGHGGLCLLEDLSDCGGGSFPAGLFGLQLALAGGREFVDAGAASGVFGDPLGPEVAGFFKTMECRVEGAFFDAEDVARDFVDGGHDGVAVEAGAAGKDFEDEEVEGALEVVGSGECSEHEA
jgi:hypothetical protein